jgi:hypothetical protein
MTPPYLLYFGTTFNKGGTSTSMALASTFLKGRFGTTFLKILYLFGATFLKGSM